MGVGYLGRGVASGTLQWQSFRLTYDSLDGFPFEAATLAIVRFMRS